MPEMVMLVTTQYGCVDEILKAWVACGVTGATILESHGLAHHMAGGGVPDDLPLIPSLASLMRQDEEVQRTVFTLVADGFDVDALVAATEQITGPLDDPHTGIMFVLPVARAWGLNRVRRPE